jgi:NAD(P)H-dependent FMN reductase
MVAMSWACEMSALAAAAEAAEGRALWMNFDSFLEDPAAALGSAFAHLGIEAAAAQIRCILSGPDMRRYAKAPEYAYNAELRRDLLNQARRTHTARIEQGMQWLLEAKTVSPIFSQVLKIADS